MRIHHSAIESRIFNLQTGRLFLQTEELGELAKLLQASHYDLINCRIASSEIDLNNYDLGDYVFEKMNLIMNFEMLFPANFYRNLNHPELQFELANESHRIILAKLIDESMNEEPIGYFKTKLLANKIDVSQELAVLKAYYDEYLNPAQSSKKIYLLKLDNNYCAFIALELDTATQTLNCPLSGILPAFRQQGIFNDIGRFTFLQAEAQGCVRFTTGARANNPKSIRAFEKELLQHASSDSVFVLLKKSLR